MRYLALDLGTKTGYAMSDGGSAIAGTWILASSRYLQTDAKLRMDRRLDIRVPRLYSALRNTHQLNPLNWIFFEDVQFSSTTKQTQLWSSLRAAVWLFAYEHKINIDCCPVSTLKKFATGYGGATKEQMLRYATRYAREFGVTNLSTFDDNAIDAIHLLSWGIQTVSRA